MAKAAEGGIEPPPPGPKPGVLPLDNSAAAPLAKLSLWRRALDRRSGDLDEHLLGAKCVPQLVGRLDLDPVRARG